MVLREYPFQNRNMQGGKNMIVIIGRTINRPYGIQAGSEAPLLDPDGERQTVRMEKITWIQSKYTIRHDQNLPSNGCPQSLLQKMQEGKSVIVVNNEKR